MNICSSAGKPGSSRKRSSLQQLRSPHEHSLPMLTQNCFLPRTTGTRQPCDLLHCMIHNVSIAPHNTVYGCCALFLQKDFLHQQLSTTVGTQQSACHTSFCLTNSLRCSCAARLTYKLQLFCTTTKGVQIGREKFTASKKEQASHCMFQGFHES